MKGNNVEYNERSIFRLRFINFGKIGGLYGYNLKELIDWPYNAFNIPEKMNVEEAFIVLSYLVKKIEEDLKLEECSQLAVTVLNKNLEKFHFKKLPEYDGEIVDLYTVTGNMKRFKKSEYTNKYFEWFTEGVAAEEVKNIYFKYGYTFKEPNFYFKK